MKIVKNVAAQGEMLIRRVASFEGGSKPFEAEGNHFILAHSETGHHHVIDRTKVRVTEQVKAPTGMAILQLIVDEPAVIEHLRGHDTHEPLMLSEGL